MDLQEILNFHGLASRARYGLTVILAGGIWKNTILCTMPSGLRRSPLRSSCS